MERNEGFSRKSGEGEMKRREERRGREETGERGRGERVELGARGSIYKQTNPVEKRVSGSERVEGFDRTSTRQNFDSTSTNNSPFI